MFELPYARRARRRPVEMPCELISTDWDEPIHHQLLDISQFGIWVRSSFPHPIGDIVVASFPLPDGDEATEFAEVTRVVRPSPGARRGMALELVGMSKHERYQLGRRLRRLPATQTSHFSFRRLAQSIC